MRDLKAINLKKQIRKTLEGRGSIPNSEIPYKKNTRKAVAARDARAAEWSNFTLRREELTNKRSKAINELYELHELLKSRLSENGIIVHEADTGLEACNQIESILKTNNAKKLLKSKTMLSEEIELNHFLESKGFQPIETDLGEYIVQLRNETPSHITMPAMHMDRQQVGKLFSDKLDIDYTDNPEELTKIAREKLRAEFLGAKVGLCGVNFAIAETGQIVTVTNEGNGRMVTTLPKVVIALMGWERVVQSLADGLETWQLLSRSATGQRATTYLNMLSKPSTTPGGCNEIHLIIVDNGRKKLHEDSKLRDILRCIRCGACLNVCPVYQQVGGHAYGSTYQGPMGSVLTPSLFGMDDSPHHPFVSTLCGACHEICPVSIPIPGLLLELRKRRVDSSNNDLEKPFWNLFTKIMENEKLYETSGKAASTLGSILPDSLGKLPVYSSSKRKSPKLASKSFKELYREMNNE